MRESTSLLKSLLTAPLFLSSRCMVMKASTPLYCSSSDRGYGTVEMATASKVSDAISTLAHPVLLPHVISYAAKQAALAVPTFTFPGTRSTGKKLPPPIRAFAEYVVQKADIPATTMLVSFVYMERIRSHSLVSTRQFPFGPHSILLTSLILSEKYCNDNARTSSCWAYVLNLSTVAINNMERQMLFLLGWDLHIDAADFYGAMEPLLVQAYGIVGHSRGLMLNSLDVRQCMGVNHSRLSRHAAFGKQLVACSVCMSNFPVPSVCPAGAFESWSSTTWPDYLDVCPLCRSFFSDKSLQGTHE